MPKRGERTTDPIRTRDGRRLDLYLGGAPDGPPGTVLYHHGSPSSGVLPPMWDAAAADLGLRLVGFSRAGYGTATGARADPSPTT